MNLFFLTSKGRHIFIKCFKIYIEILDVQNFYIIYENIPSQMTCY